MEGLAPLTFPQNSTIMARQIQHNGNIPNYHNNGLNTSIPVLFGQQAAAPSAATNSQFLSMMQNRVVQAANRANAPNPLHQNVLQQQQQQNLHIPYQSHTVTDICLLCSPPFGGAILAQTQVRILLTSADACLTENIELFVFRQRPRQARDPNLANTILASRYLEKMKSTSGSIFSCVGLRCKCCRHVAEMGGLNMNNTVFFAENAAEFGLAMNSIRSHLSSSCPMMNTAIVRRVLGISTQPQFRGTLPFHAFVEWFCGFYKIFPEHNPAAAYKPNVVPVWMRTAAAYKPNEVPVWMRQEDEKKGHSIPPSAPPVVQSPPGPQFHHKEFQNLSSAVEEGLSKEFYARMKTGKEVVFADANQIPWSQNELESPFIINFLECLELVRLRDDTAFEKKGSGIRTPKPPILKLLCRYCHGTTANKVGSPHADWLVLNDFTNNPEKQGNSTLPKAVAWLHVFAYHHTVECEYIPKELKSRLNFLKPSHTSDKFRSNAGQIYKRFQEWIDWKNDAYLQLTGKDQDSSEIVRKLPDVGILVPCDIKQLAAEASHAADQSLTSNARNAPSWSTTINGHSVMFGTEDAPEPPGNVRYRRLLAKHKKEYLMANQVRRTEIIDSITEQIRRRGGFLRKLDDTGNVHKLSLLNVRKITATAFEDGTSVIYKPIPSKRGPGSRVVDCEAIPHYDMLNQSLTSNARNAPSWSTTINGHSVMFGTEDAPEPPGNVRYRRLLAKHKKEYLMANQVRRTEIIDSITEQIRRRGGFLRKLDDTGNVHKLSLLNVRKITATAFEDGTSVIYKPIPSKRGPGPSELKKGNNMSRKYDSMKSRMDLDPEE